MRPTTAWGIRASVRMGLALVILLGLGVRAWALGPAAPPRILDAGVFIDRTNNGPFRLLAVVDGLEIPGGRVPDNVQSVTVAVPGGGTFNVSFTAGDLTPQNSYFANLTNSGVVGFPQGIYTIAITDTAGGVTTVTDALTSTGIPTATGLALSGTTVIPGAFELELDLAGTPGPTLTWNAVPGAVFYRARLRNSFNELTLSQVTTTGTTATFPPGAFLPGREYVVRLEAFDSTNPNTCSTPVGGTCLDQNARSRTDLTVFTQGPKVTLDRVGPSQQNPSLTVNIRVFNPGITTTVDALAFIKLPNGSVFSLATVRGLTIPGSVTDFFNGPLLSGVSTTGLPTGIYTVVLRLLHAATGEELALATSSFQL